MCLPVIALASLAISAVSSLAAANAQQKVANKQAYNLTLEQQGEQNALSLRMNQEATAAAQEANQRNLAAAAEAASFDAISGEYGGGVTSQRGAAAIDASRNADLGTIATNKDNTLSQLGQQARGSGLRYQSSLSSLSRPNRLGIGLSLAGSAVNAYANTQKPTPK
jgi:hypothetical protein